MYLYSGILSSQKRNDALTYAAGWMDVEHIMLSEENRHKELCIA